MTQTPRRPHNASGPFPMTRKKYIYLGRMHHTRRFSVRVLSRRPYTRTASWSLMMVCDVRPRPVLSCPPGIKCDFMHAPNKHPYLMINRRDIFHKLTEPCVVCLSSPHGQARTNWGKPLWNCRQYTWLPNEVDFMSGPGASIFVGWHGLPWWHEENLARTMLT